MRQVLGWRMGHRVVVPCDGLRSLLSLPFLRGDRAQTYQEHNRHIQRESNHRVGEQCNIPDPLEIAESHLGHLEEQGDDAVHGGANRREVVERDEGIHLELGAGEQALHHDEPDGLEHDAAALEEEADHDELDLADGGDDHADHDERDVPERLERGLRHAHDPGGDEDGDGHGSLVAKSQLAFLLFSLLFLLFPLLLGCSLVKITIKIELTFNI